MKYPARGFIILLVFCFALPAFATQRNVQTYGATGKDQLTTEQLSTMPLRR